MLFPGGANVHNAVLSLADLRGANLYAGDLHGVTFYETIPDDADLAKAIRLEG